MNVQELLAEVVTAPVVKRAITNHKTLNEAYDYGSAFSRGMRIDLNGLIILLISGTASIDEARPNGPCRGFPRPTAAYLRKYHQASGGRGCNLARHRSHYLLLARYRARLSGIQRGAYRFLQTARTRPVARVYRHSGDSLPPRSSDRDRGYRHVPAGSHLGVRRSRSMRVVSVAVVAAIMMSISWAQTSAPCSCGKNPPGPPRFPVAQALHWSAGGSASVFKVHDSLLRVLPGSRRIQRCSPRHPRS